MSHKAGRVPTPLQLIHSTSQRVANESNMTEEKLCTADWINDPLTGSHTQERRTAEFSTSMPAGGMLQGSPFIHAYPITPW